MSNHDTDDDTNDDNKQPSDPRLGEVHGDEGMPGEVLDNAHNMPGDQPEDDTPPSRMKATGQD